MRWVLFIVVWILVAALKPAAATDFMDFDDSVDNNNTGNALVEDKKDDITFLIHEECKVDRDVYCLSLSDNILGNSSDIIDGRTEIKNESYIETTFIKYLTDEVGISYDPFTKGIAKYLSTNPNYTSSSRMGFAIEESSSKKHRVNAYAMGIVVQEISNIDSVMGSFSVEMREYNIYMQFCCLLEGVFLYSYKFDTGIVKAFICTTLLNHHSTQLKVQWILFIRTHQGLP